MCCNLLVSIRVNRRHWWILTEDPSLRCADMCLATPSSWRDGLPPRDRKHKPSPQTQGKPYTCNPLSERKNIALWGFPDWLNLLRSSRSPWSQLEICPNKIFKLETRVFYATRNLFFSCYEYFMRGGGLYKCEAELNSPNNFLCRSLQEIFFYFFKSKIEQTYWRNTTLSCVHYAVRADNLYKKEGTRKCLYSEKC
jgi:hypothetical protein